MTPRELKAGETSDRKMLFFAPALKHYETDEFQQSCDCGFSAASITGNHCDLMCDHCRAVILGHMQDACSTDDLFQLARAMARNGSSGILVSGGSDRQGVVPLMAYTDAIARIRHELDMSVLVHTGLTDRRLARALAGAGVDCAMVDVIGSTDTIRRVCHLRDTRVDDYRRSLDNLVSEGVPTAPHVVIGMDHGRIDGEAAAIDMIGEFQISSLVLVGLLPQVGTPMASVEPPSPREMGEIFRYARRRLPDRPILLGCERPTGLHRLQTDNLAIEAGLDGIAYPAEGTIGRAEELGLKAHRLEVCCSLAPAFLEEP